MPYFGFRSRIWNRGSHPASCPRSENIAVRFRRGSPRCGNELHRHAHREKGDAGESSAGTEPVSKLLNRAFFPIAPSLAAALSLGCGLIYFLVGSDQDGIQRRTSPNFLDDFVAFSHQAFHRGVLDTLQLEADGFHHLIDTFDLVMSLLKGEIRRLRRAPDSWLHGPALVSPSSIVSPHCTYRTFPAFEFRPTLALIKAPSAPYTS